MRILIRAMESIGMIGFCVGAACIDSENQLPFALMALIGMLMFGGGVWFEENYYID